MLKVGNTAPAFIATTSSGEIVRLSSYRGIRNVVLFFYPKDFTAGCAKEVCDFRDNSNELLKMNAVVFGISGDNGHSHREFKSSLKLPFELLSDADGSIRRSYQVQWLFGVLPWTKRITYVIDSVGVIRSVIHHEFAVAQHIEDVKTTLQGFERE